MTIIILVLIDFGKAVKLSDAKMYHLGEIERQEYMSKYPHLAPEIVYGQKKQSVFMGKKNNQYKVQQDCFL